MTDSAVAAPPEEPPAPRRGCCGRRPRPTWPCVKAFLLKHFLVIGLVTAVVFSLACPWPGAAVASVSVGSWKVFQTINLVTIFLISGLTLKTDHIRDAGRQWVAALAGIVSIMLITPCAAFVMVELPITPAVYTYGLAIFCLVPTTVASGITLVGAARGNAALALMFTVVTNVLAVFILPFTVPLVISQAQSVDLNPVDLLIKLVMTILVPLIIGKILREISAWVRRQVDAHKVFLGLLNNGSLICIVWQTLSAAQDEVVSTAFGTLCLIALAAIVLHLVYLLINFVITKLLRLPHREAAAVLIMGSQKTLPMAVSVIAATNGALGSVGQLTVPCVLAHISQVLIDAFLCQHLGSRETKRQDAAAAAKTAEEDAAAGDVEAANGGAVADSDAKAATGEEDAGSLKSSSSTSKLPPTSDSASEESAAAPEGAVRV